MLVELLEGDLEWPQESSTSRFLLDARFTWWNTSFSTTLDAIWLLFGGGNQRFISPVDGALGADALEGADQAPYVAFLQARKLILESRFELGFGRDFLHEY